MRVTLLCAGLICCTLARAQPSGAGSAPNSPQPAAPVDLLGRSTPKGTVLGFLRAAHKGDDEAAAQYLNTRLRGQAAASLAHQLFVVLDRRLPARLNELSDRPEGGLPFLTRPDEDLVGSVISGSDKIDILVERVPQGKGSVWLFSKETLDAIPALFKEVSLVSIDRYVPAFLVRTRVAQMALFEWLGLLVGLPCLYLISSFLSRWLTTWAGYLLRLLHRDSSLADPKFLSMPVRLFMMALAIWWMLSEVTLSLMSRQLWAGIATILTITSSAWLVIVLNRRGEVLVRQRLERTNKSGPKSILRLGRRTIDFLAIFIGLLAVFHYFGVNTGAAVAGLGVGGIAVALAAQKTLENVIGGISIIFDQAVRIGDTLNVGTTMGVVESIGLRSTRIRTLDRTVVSVPNGQLANVQLENFSDRDKFWFHPTLCLHYETTAEMMRSVVEGVHHFLTLHPLLERDSIRVRFFRFGAFSLDIEIVAYIVADSWPHFLEIQEDLFMQIMRIVEGAGTRIASSSQVMYTAPPATSRSNNSQPPLKSEARQEKLTIK
jgi:MscS family membrane protein